MREWRESDARFGPNQASYLPASAVRLNITSTIYKAIIGHMLLTRRRACRPYHRSNSSAVFLSPQIIANLSALNR